ncbi:hypothetical protein OS188_12500 [Xanthomarina sp. F1114]|uniref:hypothetical protein n=1 Tax=Xanthomarina sp. F1114 TaxID=2996019 RepID=UPI00225E01F9|nr:hypothetical protein [Xanthomarina sp. F1114]MCX7548774.1 hypothetical protein [Xanthomarina sp. F1114]
MKFKGFLFLAVLLTISCSELTNNIIENNIPESKKLEVGIKNNTNYRFIRTEIIADNTTFVYQVLEPGEFSEFLEMLHIYSEAEIRIETADAYFSFSPSFFNEDTKVTNGLYYFEVNISNNQTVSITRKTF